MKSKASNARKENERVVLGGVPEQPGYRAWLTTSRTEVCSASGQPTLAYTWFLQCNNENVTDEQLMDSTFRDGNHDFEGVDFKIAASCTKIAKGLVGMELIRRTEEYAKLGRQMSGRLSFRILCAPFELDEERGLHTDILDLTKIMLKNGDAGLGLFFATWNSAVAGLSEGQTDKTLRSIFYDKIRECHCIAADIGVYDRTKKSDPDYARVHTYAFLRESVRDALDRDLRRKQKKQMDSAYAGQNATIVVPAVVSKPTKAEKRAAAKARDALPAAGAGGQQTLQNVEPALVVKMAVKSKLMCYDFQKGICKRGKDCRFAHDKKINTPPPSPGRGSDDEASKGKAKGKKRRRQ